MFDKSGSGIFSSPSFTLNGPVTVTYTYNCSSFGQAGNFQGDIETANQTGLNSDYQPFANELRTGGGATVTVYPQDQGSAYHVSINSECDWTVQVSS